MLLRCARSSTIPVRQEAVRCLWDVWFLWPTAFPRHELSSSEPLDLLSYLQDDDCVVIKASIIGVGRVLLHCPDRVAEDREHVVRYPAVGCKQATTANRVTRASSSLAGRAVGQVLRSRNAPRSSRHCRRCWRLAL